MLAPTGLRDRVIGVLTRDDATYRATKDDPAATRQALLIVGGTILAGVIARRDDALIWQLVGPLVGVLVWLVATWLTYLIGTRLLESPAPDDDWIPLLRLRGWTQLTGFATLLRPLPIIGPLLYYPLTLWGLVLLITATKIGLGIGTGRAIAINLLVGIPELALLGLILFTVKGRGWA